VRTPPLSDHLVLCESVPAGCWACVGHSFVPLWHCHSIMARYLHCATGRTRPCAVSNVLSPFRLQDSTTWLTLESAHASWSARRASGLRRASNGREAEWHSTRIRRNAEGVPNRRVDPRSAPSGSERNKAPDAPSMHPTLQRPSRTAYSRFIHTDQQLTTRQDNTLRIDPILTRTAPRTELLLTSWIDAPTAQRRGNT
jgi:hypothetical protein